MTTPELLTYSPVIAPTDGATKEKRATKKQFVYGSRYYGGSRVIAAVSSIAEFGRVAGVTRSEASNYGSETGNPEEVAIATQFPGTAWVRADSARQGEPFREVNADGTPTGRRASVKLVAVLDN